MLHAKLLEALSMSSISGERLVVDEEWRRNQVALIHAVDEARMRWPRDSISFHIVTSAYAVDRMDAYLARHIRQLMQLRNGDLSTREIFRRFWEGKNHPVVPLRNRLREWLKRQIDLRRPNPIPLVKVN